MHIAPDQPRRPDPPTRLANREHLGMRSRIPHLLHAIAVRRQHRPVLGDNHRAHRHFPARAGGAGLLQSETHGV